MRPEYDCRIPDLWKLNEDAARLYRLYLGKLQGFGLDQNVVTACPQIRRYAGRGPGQEAGWFTFDYEIDSLCELGDYERAWRRQRLRERSIAKRIGPHWWSKDAHELVWLRAPLLFFVGRYASGRRWLEKGLNQYVKHIGSFDLLPHVYNDDDFPSHRCRVTLNHFYERLGLRLRDWRHWKRFVAGFPAKLFRLTEISQDRLLADCSWLSVFFKRLMRILLERTISGTTRGQADILENPAKVRESQLRTKRKRAQFDRRIRPVQRRTDARLRKLFSELQG